MSDSSKLAVINTITDGVTIGIRNLVPILVNLILWVLTCWIPYINVGTTIGLYIGIVTKASRGEVISMTEIFDAKYRKFMGEYFLTYGLVALGASIGMIFLVIPGIVIGIAWSLALLLVVDKGKNPTEALTISNNCTYGYKWKIFGIYFLPAVAVSILSSIFAMIPGIGFLLSVLAGLFLMFVMVGLQASIYRQLTEGV